MSLLDLLEAIVSPELTAAERSRVRSLLHYEDRRAERPWASGLTVDRDRPQPSEIDLLRKRVQDLELALKVLCDLLADRHLLGPNAVQERIAAIQRQLDEQQQREQQAAQEAQEAARRAIEARTIPCASCGASVRERASYLSARGAICAHCHEAGG